MGLEFYATEVWTDKNHLNPFHQVGVIVKDKDKKFFVASDEQVWLSSGELKQIADKIDNK